jgi:four helix bundle protein
MTEDAMKSRTKEFAVRVMRLCSSLPGNNLVAKTIANHLVRSGTAVGANYRTACRSRSRREFIARLGIVEEETEESVYWMELILEAGFFSPKRLEPLMVEGREIVAMITASIRTLKKHSVE